MENLLKRYPSLEAVKNEISLALDTLKSTYENGGKLLVCGNGGSAADCDHIVGELMKCFKIKRPIKPEFAEKLSEMGEDGELLSTLLEAGLPAISLCEHNSLSTAYANDRNPYAVFAQQLSVLGNEGDTLIALTTSGNSKNCVYAATVAKAKGMKVISITGQGGGKISALADVAIKLPEKETYLIQELTLPIYHYLCAELENYFFGE
jgi:D-sedoheptulose 7-phosphate isomerase